MQLPVTEKQIQAEVVALLDLLQSVGHLVFRRIHSGARFYGGRRAKALNTGIPDIYLMARGTSGWMELKRPKGGRLSEEQIEFRDHCKIHGIPWAEVKSLGHAVEFLEKEMRIHGLSSYLAAQPKPAGDCAGRLNLGTS